MICHKGNTETCLNDQRTEVRFLLREGNQEAPHDRCMFGLPIFSGRDRRVEQHIINIQLVGGFNPLKNISHLKIPKIFESTSQSVYAMTAVQGKSQNTTPQSSTKSNRLFFVIQDRPNISGTQNCAFEIHLPHLSLLGSSKR